VSWKKKYWADFWEFRPVGASRNSGVHQWGDGGSSQKPLDGPHEKVLHRNRRRRCSKYIKSDFLNREETYVRRIFQKRTVDVKPKKMYYAETDDKGAVCITKVKCVFKKRPVRESYVVPSERYLRHRRHWCGKCVKRDLHIWTETSVRQINLSDVTCICEP